MKVVLFDINRLTFEGGAEKYFTEVGEELAKKGHDVYFLGDCRPFLKFYICLSAFQFLNPIWKLPKLFTQLNNSPTLRKNTGKYIAHIPLKFSSLFWFSSEKKKVRNLLNSADLIIIKNEIFELLFYRWLNIKNRKNYVLVFTPIVYPEAKSIRTRAHNFFYQGSFYKSLVKHIGKVIVSNENDEKLFEKHFQLDRGDIFNIPYGLGNSYFPQKNEIVVDLKFNVLFAGRMEEQKGVIYLKQIIESVNKIEFMQGDSSQYCKESPCKSISFALVGSGPLEEIPRQLAEKYSNVEYKGQLSPEEVRKFYLRSDLVIIPSKWETFSYVCLEAQACGCPVVAFNVPGPADIIQNQSGDLIMPKDLTSFEKSIWKYYKIKKKDIIKYTTFRKNISQTAKLTYSLEKTIKNIEQLANDQKFL